MSDYMKSLRSIHNGSEDMPKEDVPLWVLLAVQAMVPDCHVVNEAIHEAAGSYK